MGYRISFSKPIIVNSFPDAHWSVCLHKQRVEIVYNMSKHPSINLVDYDHTLFSFFVSKLELNSKETWSIQFSEPDLDHELVLALIAIGLFRLSRKSCHPSDLINRLLTLELSTAHMDFIIRSILGGWVIKNNYIHSDYFKLPFGSRIYVCLDASENAAHASYFNSLLFLKSAILHDFEGIQRALCGKDSVLGRINLEGSTYCMFANNSVRDIFFNLVAANSPIDNKDYIDTEGWLLH